MIRVLLALATATALVLSAAPTSAAAATKPTTAEVQQYILAKTNEARSAKGLKALTLNSSLNKVAQACSAKQAKNKKMAHCDGYYNSYPKGWTMAAENVAYGYDYKKVVEAWMNSEGHKKNILSANTDIGIGVAYDSNDRPYFTQNFAKYKQFSGKVSIAGTVKVGSKLTAKTSGYPSGTTLSYSWQADGKSIAGATKSTYKPVTAVVGKALKVKVTAKKTGYSPKSKTSSATIPVKS